MTGERPEGIASARPSAEPSTNPATASYSVAAMSSQTKSLRISSQNETATSSGCGRMRSDT